MCSVIPVISVIFVISVNAGIKADILEECRETSEILGNGCGP
jgi:hypothetical protein